MLTKVEEHIICTIAASAAESGPTTLDILPDEDSPHFVLRQASSNLLEDLISDNLIEDLYLDESGLHLFPASDEVFSRTR